MTTITAADEIPAVSTPRKGGRKPVLLAILAAGLAGGAYAGWNWYSVGRFEQHTNNAYIQADQVAVAPRTSGYVSQVLVAENQTVAAGQPLAMIDPRPTQAAADQASADIAARAADLDKALAAVRQQGAVIAQARAQEDLARSQADLAQTTYDRSGWLAQQGVLPLQQLDQAKASLAQTASAVRAQQAATAVASGQVTALDAQVATARAALAAAQAKASSAQVDLDSTVIRSAIAGRVGDLTARVGQYVAPGTRLMSVAPVQQLYVVANFKETQIARMRVGQAVTVHIDALKGTDIPGRVESFAPGTGAQFALLPPQNATGNFTKIVQRVPVRIAIDAPANVRDHLLPGLSTEVIVDTRSANDR